MPRKASGGVKERGRGSQLGKIRNKAYKQEPPVPSDSIYNIKDILDAGDTYPFGEETSWIESRCMSVAGLLPQHIRNLLMSSDIEAIAGVLHDYQDALNSASTEDAVRLYAQDGVCMPQHAQSFVGIENVRKAYEDFFSIIKFNVRFDIKEIVPVAPDWAFARTNSAGTTDVKGRGIGNEATQELFVFQKVGGEWKIARYCFSTTNPPPE